MRPLGTGVPLNALLAELQSVGSAINSFYPRPSGLPRSTAEERLLARARELERQIKVLREAEARPLCGACGDGLDPDGFHMGGVDCGAASEEGESTW